MNQIHSLDKKSTSFYFQCSEKEMKKFAQEIAKRIQNFKLGGSIIFLDGEVGSGKTTFSRYFSEHFNIEASSPTYSIIEQRQNSEKDITIIHGDFYRADTERSEEILEEYVESQNNNIYIFEWLDSLLKKDFFSDIPTIQIFFSHGKNREKRNIEIIFSNPFSCSVAKSLHFLEKYKTPVHVKNHIEMVRKIAVFCAKKLQDQNIPIDLELVESGAILHDGLRYVDFPLVSKKDEKYYREILTDEKIKFWNTLQKRFKTKHHAHAMQEILIENNLSATGKIVSSHYTGEIYRKSEFSWEEKCVYYADKRAMHDSFVTISERLIDGAKRYPYERIDGSDLEEKILKFEQELQKEGKWNEEEIQKHMKN